MTSEPNLLDLHDACVRRAGRAILQVDDFHWAPGEAVALLGPNGAGKSTFVQLLTREVMPLYREEPPVLFQGSSRATLEQVKAVVGVVSSTMADQLKVHLPVLDIVVGGLFGTVGVPLRTAVSDEERQAALAALAEVGIADLAERDVMTLSSGQARRALIARALVRGPEALVFDEPCTGLDPEGMHYVRQAMRRVAQKGKAVLLVTHYAEDIVPEVQRLLLVRDGRLVADGPKEQLLTGERMSELFGAPLRILRTGDYYSMASDY